MASQVHARQISHDQHIQEYNEIMKAVSDLPKKERSRFTATEEDFLSGLSFTSLYESLWASSYISGVTGWWEGDGEPSLEEVQASLL